MTHLCMSPVQKDLTLCQAIDSSSDWTILVDNPKLPIVSENSKVMSVAIKIPLMYYSSHQLVSGDHTRFQCDSQVPSHINWSVVFLKVPSLLLIFLCIDTNKISGAS